MAREEGEQKAKLDTALKMLRKSMSASDILEFSGITAEQLEALTKTENK